MRFKYVEIVQLELIGWFISWIKGLWIIWKGDYEESWLPIVFRIFEFFIKFVTKVKIIKILK